MKAILSIVVGLILAPFLFVGGLLLVPLFPFLVVGGTIVVIIHELAHRAK